MCCFFFNDTATTEIYTLSLHDALPIYVHPGSGHHHPGNDLVAIGDADHSVEAVGAEHGFDAVRDQLARSEEHTSELQSRQYLVCRLLLEKKNIYDILILTIIILTHHNV